MYKSQTNLTLHVNIQVYIYTHMNLSLEVNTPQNLIQIKLVALYNVAPCCCFTQKLARDFLSEFNQPYVFLDVANSGLDICEVCYSGAYVINTKVSC